MDKNKIYLRTFPDPVLKKKLSEYDFVLNEEDLLWLKEKMISIMKQKQGAAIAANQVGFEQRLFVMSYQEKNIMLINPKIIDKSENFSIAEGCLSFPGLEGQTIVRSKNIILKYLDEHAQEKTLELTDFYAICAQHEIDHLDGIVFLERLSNLKKQRALQKFAKINK